MKPLDWSLPQKGDRARARRIKAARAVWVLEPFSMPGVPRTRVVRAGVREQLITWIMGKRPDFSLPAPLGKLSHQELVELDRELVAELEAQLGARIPPPKGGLEGLGEPDPVAPSTPPPVPVRRSMDTLRREIQLSGRGGLESVGAPKRRPAAEKKLLDLTLETIWHRARPASVPEVPPEVPPDDSPEGAGAAPEEAP